MAQKKINYSFANDGLGDPLRQAFVKSDDNFDELYANKVDKVTGKSLTDVNFSAIDKAKLDSIDPSIKPQSDFDINDPLNPAFIKNKPTLLSDFDNNLDFIEDITTAGVFGRSAGAWTAIDLSSKENTANKQNSLATDGTGVKFPTVDAINENPISIYTFNLIDSNALVANTYIDALDGQRYNVSLYSTTNYIAIEGNQQYKVNPSVYQQFAIYDENYGFIEGYSTVSVGGIFRTTTNANYIRLTVSDVQPDNYLRIYDNLEKKPKVIHVAKKGGDYENIQDAVNNSLGTSEDSKQLIYVHSGIYEETVNTVGKYVAIIGVDKSSVLITTKTGNYYTPPIETAGGCYFANLTIEATSEDVVTLPTIPSYGVHMDFEGVGTTEFFNCDIMSHQNAAMGIGLHQNQTLIINNCNLIKFSDGRVYDGGSLYFHNSPFDESNQKLIVKDTYVSTDLGKSLIIDDARLNAGGVDVNTKVSF